MSFEYQNRQPVRLSEAETEHRKWGNYISCGIERDTVTLLMTTTESVQPMC